MQILTFELKNREKSAVKHFTEKAILRNFLNCLQSFFQGFRVLPTFCDSYKTSTISHKTIPIFKLTFAPPERIRLIL